MKELKSIILPILVALVLLEVLARLVAQARVDRDTAPDDWYVPSTTIGWERAPNFDGSMECGVRRVFDSRGYRAADSSQVVNDDRQKVVFVGDSTTMGFCVETEETYVELIDDRIPTADAINLGVNGYTSLQGYTTLVELSSVMVPDVVVVSFNFNDRRAILDPSMADSQAVYESAARAERFQGVIRGTYLVRSIQFALRRVGLLPSTDIPGAVTVDSLSPRVPVNQYKQNLTAIVDWANQNGTEVLFVLMGDNPARTGTLRSGINKMNDGDYLGAMEDLWITNRDAWFGDLARVYQAELFSAMQRTEEARDILWTQTYWSVHGGRPIVMDTVYHAAMREVAEANGLDVVDVRAVLNQYPGIFLDNAHFDARGHRIAADALVGPIRNSLARARSRDSSASVGR